MSLDNVLQVWPVVVIVGFLAILGFMRAITSQIDRQLNVHDVARTAMKMRQEHLRRRQEQLQHQRELMNKQ